jgi:DNA-binding CsgD family transcriptional regulator
MSDMPYAPSGSISDAGVDTDVLRFLLSLAGLAFYWLWLISGVFSTIVWYVEDGQHAAWTWLVTVAANLLALMLIVVINKRKVISARRSLIIASSVVTAAGIACVSLAYNFEQFRHLLLIGCVATGLGAALPILCWQGSAALMDFGTAKNFRSHIFPFSMTLSIVLYLLVASLPFFVALIICSLAPITSTVFFLAAGGAGKNQLPSLNDRALRQNDSSFNGSSSNGSNGSKKNRRRWSWLKQYRAERFAQSIAQKPCFVSLILCTCVISLALGYYKASSPQIGTQLSVTLIVSSAILFLVGIVVLEIFLLRRQQGGWIAAIFLPISTIACLAIPFFYSETPFVTHFFVFAGNFLLLVYLYSAIDTVSLNSGQPTQVFAMGLIFCNIGCILGIVTESFLISEIQRWIFGVLYLIGSVASCLWHERQKRLQDSFSPTRAAATAGSRYNENLSRSLTGLIPERPATTESLMVQSIANLCHLTAIQYALSPREEEILCYLVRGKSAKSLAAITYISYNTVKTHISHIYQKLNIHTREDLILLVETSQAD